MKERELYKDSDILSELSIHIDLVISDTPWENVQYTVPGSMEKMIEVKGGLINAFNRIQKGIQFINKGKENEDNQESEEIRPEG